LRVGTEVEGEVEEIMELITQLKKEMGGLPGESLTKGMK